MVSDPMRVRIFHFTHIDNLASIIATGLGCDSHACPSVDVGNHDIKQRRAERKVPVPPGGVVADYVPFYFAPRSPMITQSLVGMWRRTEVVRTS